MRALSRSGEFVYAVLLFAGLVLPLTWFFGHVLVGGVLTASGLFEFFSQPGIQKSILNTLILSGITSALSTGIAFSASWFLWRYQWPDRPTRLVSLLLKLPYLLPPFFFAMGWVALCAPEVGWLNLALIKIGMQPAFSIYGLSGTCFVLVLWTTALAMIQLQAFFTQFPGQLEDAAILCGASPMQVFFRITLPLARTQLFSCVLLTAVSSMAAFGVPALLASPARQYVVTTRIYQSIKSSQDFSQAGWLSLMLLMVTLVMLGLQSFFSRGASRALVSGKAARPARLVPSVTAWLAYAGIWGLACIACLLPGLAVLTQSFLKIPNDLTSLTFEKYVYVFAQIPDSWIAMGNSGFIAILTAFIVTILGLLLAYGAARLNSRVSRFLIEALSIGYALPGTVIALALLVYYAGSLTNTLWILVAAYLVKYAAFALRTLGPATASISKELEEAAWMCGASPLRAFFKALVPMLKPALMASMLLALVPMLSELTMSVLLIGPGTETLGTLIYRLQEYSDPGAASVLAISVSSAVLLLNLALKRASKGSFGI